MAGSEPIASLAVVAILTPIVQAIIQASTLTPSIPTLNAITYNGQAVVMAAVPVVQA